MKYKIKIFCNYMRRNIKKDGDDIVKRLSTRSL